MSPIVRSLDEVGRHFGKCRRTAQRWARAGMPKLTGDRYSLSQVEAWLRSKRYLGANFRQLEEETKINSLFEAAVLELRRGLENLCQAFVSCRGKRRQALIDHAVREILHIAMHQGALYDLGALQDPGAGEISPPNNKSLGEEGKS